MQYRWRMRSRLAEVAEAAEVPEATAKRKRIRARNRAVDHEKANLEAARIIASQPDRYQGLLLEWAHMVLRRRGQQPCFCGEETRGK